MNNTIQFYHDQSNDMTFAVDINFDREDILEIVHHFDNPIELMVGQSFVHPNDNYCKKTGREVSSSKLAPIEVRLKHLLSAGDKIYLYLRSDEAELEIQLRVNKNSSKPHLIKILTY